MPAGAWGSVIGGLATRLSLPFTRRPATHLPGGPPPFTTLELSNQTARGHAPTRAAGRIQPIRGRDKSGHRLVSQECAVRHIQGFNAQRPRYTGSVLLRKGVSTARPRPRSRLCVGGIPPRRVGEVSVADGRSRSRELPNCDVELKAVNQEHGEREGRAAMRTGFAMDEHPAPGPNPVAEDTLDSLSEEVVRQGVACILNADADVLHIAVTLPELSIVDPEPTVNDQSKRCARCEEVSLLPAHREIEVIGGGTDPQARRNLRRVDGQRQVSSLHP